MTFLMVMILTYCTVQSSLKKSEWETKPEGYRDPANADKLPKPRQENILERGALGGAI